MSGPFVLVVGDVMLDRYWHGDVTRISPEAPVPVVSVTRVEDRLGGAANVAANVVALGGQCTLMGVSGGPDGTAFQALARSKGIDLALQWDTAMTVKTRIMGRGQQIGRADVDHAPDGRCLDQMLEDFGRDVCDFDVVVISDYGKGALRDVRQMIQIARQAGKPVLVDPKGTDWARYRGATLIKPNLSEIEAVVGKLESDSSAIANLRQSLEVDAILVTRGAGGMDLHWEGETIHQRAHAREVFDVTGAGDTVIAAMAVAHAKAQGWARDMHFASAAAGIVVGKVGTATATADEVWRALDA